MDQQEYWRIYRAVSQMMESFRLIGTDSFICECIERVQHDADADWNEDDVRMAIRNTLNETIEKIFGVG